MATIRKSLTSSWSLFYRTMFEPERETDSKDTGDCAALSIDSQVSSFVPTAPLTRDGRVEQVDEEPSVFLNNFHNNANMHPYIYIYTIEMSVIVCNYDTRSKYKYKMS